MYDRRMAAVAGQFYEGDAAQCADDAAFYCQYAEGLAEGVAGTSAEAPPGHVYGAVVPHAGWVCSGRVAGMTYAALRGRTKAKTFVLTGSVHTVRMDRPTVDPHDVWETPVGDVVVDGALRDAIGKLDGFCVDAAAHAREHSLEVQAPLMRTVFGEELKIVGCLVPPHEDAVKWGESLGELLKDWGEEVCVIASSDLTHYGPNYSFNPGGYGDVGYRWAHENDRRLLEMIERYDAESVVSETCQRQNACGGGAIAATMAACRVLGATRGFTLEHTDSTRELSPLGHGDANNSVGYASVLLA